MPDEQTTPVSQTTATPSEGASSGEQQTQSPEPTPSRKGSWLDRVLGRVPSEPPSEAASQPTADASGKTPDGTPQEKPREAQGNAAPKREVTDEELARLVQAEVDRREAKRKADEARQRKAELRKTDPFKYAEQEEHEEQLQAASAQFHEWVGGIAREYDRAVLDPLVLALPEDQRKTVIEAGGSDPDGRKAITVAAIDALKKASFAEGERAATEKLRKDPAFRKQLLLEIRGQRDEPEHIPAATGAATSTDMNTVIRTRLAKK
jgi:hypothetical protein